MIEIEKLIRKNVVLKRYSRFNVGGIADFFSEPSNIYELQKILTFSAEKCIPFQIIGNGSNVLFDDAGYRGLIIRIGHYFSKYEITGEQVIAEAGIWMPCLARITANYGLSGLEHTIGIPGTLGGLIIMNGGSLRKSISESIQKVVALDFSGKEFTYTKDECNFSYRHSIFQLKPSILYKVVLNLTKANSQSIRSEMISILKTRRKKFPLKIPSCGSVFINNPSLYENYGSPGKIIQELGLKGYSWGGASISTVHANFIVNTGNATSIDIIHLIRDIRNKIYKKTNFWIESEIRYLPPESNLVFIHEYEA